MASKQELKEELVESLLNKVYLKANRHFYTFVLVCAPIILPDKFVNGPHLKLICNTLEELHYGTLKDDEGNSCSNVMLFMPPGSMKSLICSVLFPAWVTGKDETTRTLAVSHSIDLPEGFGEKIRDLTQEPEYQKIFPNFKLKKDSRGKRNWATDAKGGFKAAGAGVNIAGFRFNLGVMDDLLSEQTAISDSERTKINKWYGPGFRSRGLNGNKKILVNTRWHTDDISAFILAEQKKNPKAERWKVISIPALVDEKASTLLNLPVGTSYWPDLWPTEYFMQIRDSKETMPPHMWNALYMQNPTPEAGAIIKVSMFKKWLDPDPPYCKFVLQTLDTAFSTRNTADFSVIQTWGIFTQEERDHEDRRVNIANAILLGNRRGRWEFPELITEAKAAFDQHKPDRIIIEKKASGQSLLQELRRLGYPVSEYLPDRDKRSRVYASTPIMESGRVWLPEGKEWAQELIDEALTFPYGKHDDQVDCLTMAVRFLRDDFRIEHPTEPEYEEIRLPPRRSYYWGLGL